MAATCPNCSAELKVRAEYAGKRVECPRCHAVVTLPLTHAPAREAHIMESDLVPADPPPLPAEPFARRGHAGPDGWPCPQCGEVNRLDARRCRRCQARLDDGREPGRRGGVHVSCPSCRAPDPEKVTWTVWGSFYGPALFNHVRCRNCGYAYNGRTGRPNTVPIVLFVTIPLFLILALIAFIVILLTRRAA